jgi:hypothetical protein
MTSLCEHKRCLRIIYESDNDWTEYRRKIFHRECLRKIRADVRPTSEEKKYLMLVGEIEKEYMELVGANKNDA